MSTPACDSIAFRFRLNHLEIQGDDSALQSAMLCEKVESKGRTTYNEVDARLSNLRIEVSGQNAKHGKTLAEEAVKKDAEAGVLVPNGREDILPKVLGKAEHPGRVRGVSCGIGIKEYFGKPSNNPTPTDSNRLQGKDKYIGRATKGNSYGDVEVLVRVDMDTVNLWRGLIHYP